MLNAKLRFIRIFDRITTEKEQIVNEFAEKVSDVGRIFDDNLGFGFRLSVGQAGTLKEYLYPEGSLTNNEAEKTIDQIKNSE